MKQVRIKNLETGNVNFAIMPNEDSEMLCDKFVDNENIEINILDILLDNLDTFEDVSTWDVFKDKETWY